MSRDTTSSTSSRSSANASDSDASLPSRAVSTPPSKDALSDADPSTDGLSEPLSRMNLKSHDSSSSVTSNAAQEPATQADEQIVEALKSGKDRIFVLKLGEQMENLIKESASRTKIVLTPESSYQRLLVHRCAAYYKLQPESSPTSHSISLLLTLESCLPIIRISELVPVEEAIHPTFKIMRRSEQDRKRSRASASQPGSVVGEDGGLSDGEPSESGSLSRSGTAKHRTIAEREAAYQEARSRIFTGFEPKDKASQRGTSASSSTLSLISGSGSNSGGGGGSSVNGDIEDSVSSAPTESEFSDHIPRDTRELYGMGYAGPSSRPFRPGSFHAGSSMPVSGTGSPAFNYPSLYDHAAPPPPAFYENQQAYGQPPPQGYGAPYPVYAYPPPPPGQMPGQPYYAPYPMYPQFAYYGRPPPLQTNSDPTSPVVGPVDAYQQPPPPGAIPYGQPYMWPHPPMHPAAMTHPPPGAPHMPQHQGDTQSPHPGQSHSGPTSPLPQGPPFGQPYPPMGQIPYGMPPQFYPQPQQPPPPPMQPQPHGPPHPSYSPEFSPLASSSSSDISNGGHMQNSGRSSRNSNGHTAGGPPKRGAPPTRGAWSYGPGVGIGGAGMSVAGVNAFQQGQTSNDTVGPRLSNSRKNTASSTGSVRRSPSDETTSTTPSSSTSTNTSLPPNMTPPSKHPLPARPDWAAGLKPKQGLYQPHPKTRHHDSTSSSRNMSPARPPMHLSQGHGHQPSGSLNLQPNDFPPLSMSSSADKRPAVGGVWGNGGSTRSILMPNTGHTNNAIVPGHGSALMNHTAMNGIDLPNNGAPPGMDDEAGFKRPPPKGSAELFNPKAANGPKRSGSQSQHSMKGDASKAQDGKGSPQTDAKIDGECGAVPLTQSPVPSYDPSVSLPAPAPHTDSAAAPPPSSLS